MPSEIQPDWPLSPIPETTRRIAPNALPIVGKRFIDVRVLAATLLLIAYIVALVASVGSDSLWADEAFSAWVACQRSLSALFGALLTGDSSDLQMLFYYVYLHLCVNVLGASEWALRVANAPFAVLFGAALFFTSTRVFRLSYAWIAPALVPFIWVYLNEARPYFAVLACSTASLSCLLELLYVPRQRWHPILPFLCFSLLFIAAGFHMLALLAAPPMLLVALLANPRSRYADLWREWSLAIFWFTLPYLVLGAYFAFTFLRGTTYLYPPPGLSRFGYTLYELSGLMGVGPNHLDMWLAPLRIVVRPYLPVLVASCFLLAAGLTFALLSYRSGPPRNEALALGWAAALAVAETVALSIITGHQISSRHFAALLPMGFFLYLALLNSGRLATWSVAALCLVWALANFRLLILPEYQKEAYRPSVAAAIAAAHQSGGEIAWEPDPLAARYYGLEFLDQESCYPLPEPCGTGFARVDWPKSGRATAAVLWKRDQIDRWLRFHRESKTAAVVVLRTSRPYEVTDWKAALAREQNVTRHVERGIEILTVRY